MSPNGTGANENRSSNADRRRFLKVAGTAGAVGLAGCAGNGGGGDGTDDTDGGGGTTDDTDTSGGGEDTVKIGVIYPLTGNLGEVGQNIQAFLDPTAEQIINGTDSGLNTILLSEEEGLPNLDNRKVELDWAEETAQHLEYLAS